MLNQSIMETPTLSFPTSEQIRVMRTYIKETWRTLYRSHEHLLDAAQDPKLNHHEGDSWLIYVSLREDVEEIRRTLSQSLSDRELDQIDLQVLPAEPEKVRRHGLLYLPHSYVVPGGRFNEMYGWDSYFIQLGLLRDQEMALACNMVEQLVYEINIYGMILNANRTYMLARSQPPILTHMVLAYYKHVPDKEWLRQMLPAVERYYYYWTVPPHLNPATGLSRYYSLGLGPAPEVVASERDDAGRSHYDRVREYYRENSVDDYDVALYYDRESDRLTEYFYRGDRSMRESGFDITNRFGPFSVDIVHYVPVCLNSLLYAMEKDTAKIHEILGHSDVAEQWHAKAAERYHSINTFLWNEEAGLYLDYNCQYNHQRYYPFLSTFYPLWVGLASEHQAARVMENLSIFEREGGLQCSDTFSGNQWDAPFGWAPLHLIAVEGMLRYGYKEDAHRIARKFISLVATEFEKQGTLLEKYDVEACSGQVSDEIKFGYSSNETGFGWTNGVILELLAILNEGE
jgi:alpha,alpha-trehalase